MRKKKIFTPIIAVGLAMSLSVGSEANIDTRSNDIIVDNNISTTNFDFEFNQNLIFNNGATINTSYGSTSSFTLNGNNTIINNNTSNQIEFIGGGGYGQYEFNFTNPNSSLTFKNANDENITLYTRDAVFNFNFLSSGTLNSDINFGGPDFLINLGEDGGDAVTATMQNINNDVRIRYSSNDSRFIAQSVNSVAIELGYGTSNAVKGIFESKVLESFGLFFYSDNSTLSLTKENDSLTMGVAFDTNVTIGNIDFDAPNISLGIGDGSFSLKSGKTLNFNINENAILTQSLTNKGTMNFNFAPNKTLTLNNATIDTVDSSFTLNGNNIIINNNTSDQINFIGGGGYGQYIFNFTNPNSSLTFKNANNENIALYTGDAVFNFNFLSSGTLNSNIDFHGPEIYINIGEDGGEAVTATMQNCNNAELIFRSNNSKLIAQNIDASFNLGHSSSGTIKAILDANTSYSEINFNSDNSTLSLVKENAILGISRIGFNYWPYGADATIGNIDFDAPNISLGVGNGSFSLESGKTLNFNINKNAILTQSMANNGTMNFNIANTSSLTLSNNGEKTSITTNGNGAMTLDFQGSSGSFSGKLIANFSSKSGNNLISFAQSGTFGFDAILEAQQGYNRMEINQDITITTDIYATGASDESVDRGNSFIINNGKSLTLNSDNSKKTIYTQGGETTLSFQKTGSFSGNLNTHNGLLELDFKAMETGDYTIDLDTDFYAGANGENRIRFYDSTRNLILRSDGGFSFRGEGNGNNSIFIGSSGTKISFTNNSNTTQTLTYNGGENTITFANTGQTLEANILNTQGNLTFVFGSNEKGITIGQATINGNITANGGNNAFSFLYDSSTLSMGTSSQIIANSTSTNTFTIDRNITLFTDLTLSGNATGNGGNIFNVSNGKDLVLRDSSSTIKTLYTTGGQSKITFEGSGNLVANLSTSGGVATFNLGTIQNTKMHLRTPSTLITKGGYAITSGKSIFNLNLPSSILEMQGGNGNALALQTNGGETEFNFNSSNELKVASLTTLNGDTKINFNSPNNTLTTTSGISTTSGNTTIALSRGASGRIIGSFEKTGGSNILDFSNNSYLTLTGANNTITQINGLSSIQSATLALDSSSNALNALISSSIIGNSLILDFQGGNTDARSIHLTLSGNNNALRDIFIAGTKNTLTLNSSNTSIAQGLLIRSGGIIFDIKDGANLTFTQGATSDTSLGMQFDFYGSSNIDGIIHTTENGALHGTVINLKNNANATFKKAIQTDNGASSVVNFESNTSNQAQLTLEATNNTISEFNILNNTSGILKGKEVEISVFVLGENAGANFTLANSSSTIDNLTTSFQGNTLTLDSSETNVALSIKNPISDNNLILNFKSQNNTAIATLENAGNTLYALRIESGNKNTLVLTNGVTTISSAVRVGENQALTFDLANGTTLNLTNGLTTNATGATTFNLGSGNAPSVSTIISGTLSNIGTNIFSINSATTTLKYGTDGLSFSSGINEINFANTTGATLSWKDSGGSNLKAISTTGGNTIINFNNNGIIVGGVETNSSSGGITNINIFDNATGTIGGAITLGANGGSNNVVFKGSNGGLILKDNATLTSLSSQGSNNTISLYHNNKEKDSFKTLTIGTKGDTSKTAGISGNGLSFLVYAISNAPEVSSEAQPSGKNASKVYADKIIIHSSSNEGVSTHHLGVVFEDGTILNDITYEKGGDNNILVASVATESGVSFNKTEKTILGFTTADVSYTTEDVVDNGVAYKNYYVKGADNLQVAEAEQAVTATAFTLNYDLYMANLNSLNKRMGELRDNAHSQGVWARVFNGAQTNNFGLGSKNNYTTIQAGYDYAFGFEGANNYLGVALSYALSTSTTSSKAVDSMGEVRSIDSIYSNAVEVALYNSYVSDSGWYNDSIAKFSYLMSSFDIANSGSNITTNNNTTNFALTLGDEVGYVFKLGEAKEWSITPQVEFTMGYFNQSDFKQTLSDSSAYLDSIAESVLTLRTRVGSAFAYDFKNFTQKDSFNASLYIGAFYEYDYVSGGNITMSTDQGVVNNELSDIGSDGRVVMNVGTNMSIKDNTRLYFDFEKSFAGKITTDYQVNFGVRYSFGESNGYTPMIEKSEFKAPLKIEGEEKSKEEQGDKEKNEDKAQESKKVEKATDKTQENEKIKEEKKEQKEMENKEDSAL